MLNSVQYLRVRSDTDTNGRGRLYSPWFADCRLQALLYTLAGPLLTVSA